MRYRSWKTTAVSSTLTWTRKSCISVLTEAWKSCGGPSGQMIFTSCLHTWPCSTGLRRPSSHPTTMTCQDLCCRPIGRAALCDLNIILVPLDFHFIIETTIGTAQMVLGAGGGYAHPSRFALGPGKTRRTSTWCLCGASGSLDIFWPTTAWIIQSRWYPKSWATGVWVYGRQALQSLRTSSMTLSTSPAELRGEKICRGRRHMSIVFWGWQLFVLTAQWWQFAGIICCVRPRDVLQAHDRKCDEAHHTWQTSWPRFPSKWYVDPKILVRFLFPCTSRQQLLSASGRIDDQDDQKRKREEKTKGKKGKKRKKTKKKNRKRKEKKRKKKEKKEKKEEKTGKKRGKKEKTGKKKRKKRKKKEKKGKKRKKRKKRNKKHNTWVKLLRS